jgi:predicted TIM-barrel enzyme
MSIVLPVVHHRDVVLTFEQVDLAMEAGADGVFLISHGGDDFDLMDIIIHLKKETPDIYVGVNFLSMYNPVEAYNVAATCGANAVWLDDAGVSSESTTVGEKLASARQARHGREDIFASVAFKYQAYEPNPAQAAANALRLGFIPTTSGSGTGQAPAIEKIAFMSAATNGLLGIASGMTPENVGQYAPMLSHILVATGVSEDMHHFDYEKLTRFIAIAKRREDGRHA